MEKQARIKTTFESIFRHHIHNIGIWDTSHTYGVIWATKASIVAFLLVNIAQVIAMYNRRGDSNALLECFSILSFCVMGSLKLQSLLANRERWQLLISHATSLENGQLGKCFYQHDYKMDDDENGETFERYIGSYTKKFKTISTYLSRIYSLTIVVFMASIFIEYGLCFLLRNDVDGYPHILPMWTPLDVSTVGYLLTLTTEFVASLYCVSVHITFDLSAIGLMIFIRGQFALLHNYSERIGGRGERFDLSTRRDNIAHFRIKRCHHIHAVLLKLVNDLGKLIQNILGIYCFLATLTLCTVAVQLQSNQLSAAQLISLLQYMGATLTQLFLFCLYGSEVVNNSSVGLGEGPRGAAYWSLSPKIRREVALLAVGMARPCQLKAGPLSTLDLPLFLQVVRTAYSYYAVLSQTSE